MSERARFEVSIIDFEKGHFVKTTSLVPMRFIVDFETMEIHAVCNTGQVSIVCAPENIQGTSLKLLKHDL